jgi:hypothetical protein
VGSVLFIRHRCHREQTAGPRARVGMGETVR